MTTYQITSAAGMDMGTYAAESREAAIEAMHRGAGYESSEAAAEALSTTVEALSAELTVTELTAKAWIGLGWDALTKRDRRCGRRARLPDGTGLRFDDTSVEELSSDDRCISRLAT